MPRESQGDGALGSIRNTRRGAAGRSPCLTSDFLRLRDTRGRGYRIGLRRGVWRRVVFDDLSCIIGRQGDVMEIRGKVNGGVVVLDDPHALPDGALVRVVPVAEQTSDGPEGSTVWDALRRWGGRAKGLPSDFAEQHDHYLHGTRRR